jgi:hypothetical protein
MKWRFVSSEAAYTEIQQQQVHGIMKYGHRHRLVTNYEIQFMITDLQTGDWGF